MEGPKDQGARIIQDAREWDSDGKSGVDWGGRSVICKDVDMHLWMYKGARGGNCGRGLKAGD